MSDSFQAQLEAIEAANAHEATELEPGQGDAPEPQESAPDPDVNDAAPPADDVVDGDEAGDAPEGEHKRRRSKPASARIAELTARLRDAERRLEAAPAEPAKAEPAPLVEPDPTAFEYGDADPKYLAAMVDYKVETRERTRDAQQAEQRKVDAQAQRQQDMHRALSESVVKAEAEAKAKYADFDTKIAEAADARGGEPLPALVTIGIAVSPVGGDIIYRLATDEAAADKLESLARNPQALAMALGELEGEYIDGTDDADLDITDQMDMARMMGRMRARVAGRKAPQSAKAEVKPTNAPEPPTGRAKGGAGNHRVSPDTDDMGAFMREYGAGMGL